MPAHITEYFHGVSQHLPETPNIKRTGLGQEQRRYCGQHAFWVEEPSLRLKPQRLEIQKVLESSKFISWQESRWGGFLSPVFARHALETQTYTTDAAVEATYIRGTFARTSTKSLIGD